MNNSYAPNSPSPLIKKTDLDTFYLDEESFVERWLLLPKLLYFMLNMFVYAFHGLMAFLFVEQWKFSFYFYGYATTIIATNFFGAMIWTSLADKTGRYKAIIISTAILFTIVACSMGMYRPKLGADGTLPISTYVVVFLGFGLFNFFLSAAFPLLDAQILGMLSANPKLSKEQFGTQRMYGAVGHFCATLISFFVYDKKDPKGPVIFQLIISILFILCVWFGVKDVKPVKHGHYGNHSSTSEKGKELIRRSTSSSPFMVQSGPHQVPVIQAMPLAPTPAPPSAADELSAEGTGGVKHPIITLLTNPNFMFFMLFISCCGVVRSVTSSFQKIIGMKASGDDKMSLAAVDLARMSSEIIVYILAKPLKNVMGVYWILVFSQLIGILRLFGYGAVDPKASYAYYLAWVLELMKGFSSGMISSSAIPIASRIATAGCEGSAQGLFSGNYSGLSMAMGGIIGGAILQIYHDPALATPDKNVSDAQAMFNWVAVGTLLVTLMMMIKFIFIDRVMGLPGLPRRSSLPS